ACQLRTCTAAMPSASCTVAGRSSIRPAGAAGRPRGTGSPSPEPVMRSTGGAPGLPAGAHHLIDGVAHGPAEIACGELPGGDDAVGVAGASRTDDGLEVHSGDAHHSIHDLLHAQPVTRAEVVRRLDGLAG